MFKPTSKTYDMKALQSEHNSHIPLDNSKGSSTDTVEGQKERRENYIKGWMDKMKQNTCTFIV